LVLHHFSIKETVQKMYPATNSPTIRMSIKATSNTSRKIRPNMTWLC